MLLDIVNLQIFFSEVWEQDKYFPVLHARSTEAVVALWVLWPGVFSSHVFLEF